MFRQCTGALVAGLFFIAGCAAPADQPRLLKQTASGHPEVVVQSDSVDAVRCVLRQLERNVRRDGPLARVDGADGVKKILVQRVLE